MNERKTETIQLKGGVEYAKVAARVAEFHRDNPECSIETTCEFKEGFVLFCSRVTTKKGIFTGHSLGKVSGREKQFEKQETISAGRALAFAGYLSSGEIACYEEMQELVTTAQLNALVGKHATVFAEELQGLNRQQKQQRFNGWARSVVGEEVNYLEPTSWLPQWMEQCWQSLLGYTPDAETPQTDSKTPAIDPEIPF